MKILITGGLGFVGLYLSKKFIDSGNKVTILEYKVPAKLSLDGVNIIEADSTIPGAWQKELIKNDVIINLAGASIFQKWNNHSKKIIYDSRILTTRNISSVLKKSKDKKITLISTSAVGYYGFHGDEILNEDAAPGEDFLANVAHDWEAEALKAAGKNIRVIISRFGIVLGKNGGVIQQMAKVFNSYLGTRFGNGKQWFSWIHIDDLASIMEFFINKSKLDGPFNCTAPNPVTNKELTIALSRALRKPVIFPFVPAFALKLAQGEMSNLVLKGQQVLPQRLLDAGFSFRFPRIQGALKDIC